MCKNEQESKPIYRNHSKLLISESPLQVLPTLAVKIGLNEALMLQQVHYWISNPMNKNVRDGRVWVYKTYAEWKKEFPFWSMITIKRTSYALEKMGLLLSTSEFNRLITDRTKWYTLDYDKLESLEIGTSYQNDTMDVSNRDDGRINLIRSIPETTTEITIENNNNNNVRKVIGLPKKVVSHVELRPVVEPKLKPEPKTEPVQEAQQPNGVVVVDSEIDDLMSLIRGWAISKVLLRTWAKKRGIGYVLQKIELTKSAISQGKVKNRGAYLNKAIELDWLPPAPHEDEVTQNKPVEPTFPTHEENVAWYGKLDDNEKMAVLREAVHKQGYFEGHLKNANISVLDTDFTSNSFFKMMMGLVGRAR